MTTFRIKAPVQLMSQGFSISTLPALVYDFYFFFTIHRFLKNEMALVQPYTAPFSASFS